jgi:hypothetical protein
MRPSPVTTAVQSATVVVANPVQAVGGHHRAFGQVPLAGPVEGVVGELDAVAAADGVEQ